MVPKYSSLGIASCISSIVLNYLFLPIILVGASSFKNECEHMILGLMVILFLLANLTAFSFGLAGYFIEHQKKALTITGMIFSTIGILIIVAYIIIGLSA
jgi:hypothetical protein